MKIQTTPVLGRLRTGRDDKGRRVAASIESLVETHYHILMSVSDTSSEARARQLEIVRAMSGEERVLLAYEMSMFMREVMKEGIRRDHPQWTEEQTTRELLRRAFSPAPLPAWLR